MNRVANRPACRERRARRRITHRPSRHRRTARRAIGSPVAGLLAVALALEAALVAPAPAGAGAPPPREVTSGLGINQVAPVGASGLWAIVQNEIRPSGGAQRVEVTSDAGATWRTVTPPGLAVDGATRYLTSVSALSTRHAAITYGAVSGADRSYLATTSDAGRRWTRVGPLPANCSVQFVSPREGTCTVLGGAAGSMAVIIYRTANGGATWRRVFASAPSTTTPPGSLPFGCDKTITFETASTGWALFFCNAGSGAIIDATTDGGATWSPRAVTPPRTIPEGGGGFTGPGVFRGARGAVPYVVGTQAAIYVTRNGGHSFAPVYPPGPPRPWAVDVISPTQWRLTLGRQILGTNDAGASWFRFTSTTVLRATSYGRGAPPGGLVTFTTASDAWLLENAGGTNAALLRSSNGGRSWRRVAVPGVG